jgi:hypothetical protein
MKLIAIAQTIPTVTLIRVNPTVLRICNLYQGKVVINYTTKSIDTLVKDKLENEVIKGIFYPSTTDKQSYVLDSIESLREFRSMLDLNTEVEFCLLTLYNNCQIENCNLKVFYQGSGSTFKLLNLDVQNKCFQKREQVPQRKKRVHQVNMEQYEKVYLGLH